jgi:hypothetical protein
MVIVGAQLRAHSRKALLTSRHPGQSFRSDCPWPMAAIMAAGQPQSKDIDFTTLDLDEKLNWVPFKNSS